jgi:alpha-tubulin suppressor-like RCC1 family protein
MPWKHGIIANMRALQAVAAMLCLASNSGCAGCIDVNNSFPCTLDSDCLQGAELGVCTDELCAFRDSSCDSGLRFGDLSGDRSGDCTVATDFDAAPGEDLRLVSVVAGQRHSCALEESGRVFCWGDNTQGQVGAVTLSPGIAPTEVELDEPVTTLAAGARHTCALAAAELWCWGDNQSGQLGTTAAVSGPNSTPLAVVDEVRDVDAGDAHTCVIRTDNSLYCWGQGGDGQIGDNAQEDRSIPAVVDDGQTPGVRFERLALGARHSCATVLNTGTNTSEMLCWGNNEVNQHGTATPSPVLVPTSALPAAAGVLLPSADGDTTCVIRAASLSCFGANANGQAGVEATDPVTTPTAVSLSGSGATQVAVGRQHSCASQQGAGFLFCFGTGENGELGVDPAVPGPSSPVDTQIPIADSFSVPPAVGTDPLRVLAVGDDHGCTIVTQTNDKVWCWGSNAAGQLGFESSEDVLVPTLVPVPR